MPSKIKVKKIFENESKTGKKYWKVIDENNTSYSVWDEVVIKQISEGQTITAGIEDSKGYLNIKSVIPESFAGDIPSGFDDLIPPDARYEPASQTNPMHGIPPTKKVVDEVRLIIEERIAAMSSASLLVAHGKAAIADLETLAESMISFYHQTSVPKVPKPDLRSTSEEYIA